MSLLAECEEHFGVDDLYGAFKIKKDASAAEVKKAYYKMSMICHPDKAGTSDEAKQEATARFQLVSKVYAILSDKEKRAVYDETGIVDEEDVITDEDSVKLWRTVFKKVTKEDIEQFFDKYKGSEEEEADIIAIYQQHDGDMGIMLEYIMSQDEDETRIKELIDQLIKDGKLKATKKYKATTSPKKKAARSKRAAQEAKEAEEMMENIAKEQGTNDLQALILKRQADRGKNMDGFFDSLAAKYAPKKKAKK